MVTRSPAWRHNASASSAVFTSALQPIMRHPFPQVFKASALARACDELSQLSLHRSPGPLAPHPHLAHAGALVAARIRTLATTIRCLCMVVLLVYVALALSRVAVKIAMHKHDLCSLCTAQGMLVFASILSPVARPISDLFRTLQQSQWWSRIDQIRCRIVDAVQMNQG